MLDSRLQSGRSGRAFLLSALCLISSLGFAEGQEDYLFSGYMDGYYGNDMGGSNDEIWRSKGTTQRLNMPTANIASAILSKATSDESPLGGELGFMAGSNTNGQVPSSSALPGVNILRYLSRANISYQVSEIPGLKLTAGLMNSFIGYESFFAGQSFNFTRAYIADYTPYFLIGAGGQYVVDENLSFCFYLVSDYNYLQFLGHQPKYASQINWVMDPEWTLTENVFFGPEQNTSASLQYWRGLADSIVQWHRDDLTLALAYDIGTEQLATSQLRTVWMGSAFWTRWNIEGPWSVSVRPEVYWDPNGEMTGYQQFIRAVTLTGEYKMPVGDAFMAIRTEFRHDNSTGPQGGFYNPQNNLQQLVPGQNVFFMSMIWSFDQKF
jgi:hypothetical protein